ncbi:MAG: putative maltokinase, partial [Chthoniobacterales bacterium]
PMQWSPDRNAGFSKANPQQLYLPITIDPEYHYEAINVENQQKNLSSLLWWMRRMIAMRKNFKAFSRGSLEFLFPENSKVLAFLRKHEDETILVIVNLSRFSQAVELDLSRFAGSRLMELFSQNYFPAIKEVPYPVTLGPHSHYWFALRPQPQKTQSQERIIPTIENAPALPLMLSEGLRGRFERDILPNYVHHCRWFGGKARSIRELRVIEQVPVAPGRGAEFWFLEITYADGNPETYALAVEVATGDAARALQVAAPHAVIARLGGADEVVLHDAIWDGAFRDQLFAAIAAGAEWKGRSGTLRGVRGSALLDDRATPASHVLSAEQSNSSMLFENKYFLKLYRKLEDGVNPDVEITRFLSERRNFAHVPSFAGAIEYLRSKGEPTVVCLLQTAATNEGDAWELTLDAVGRYYERVLARKADLQKASASPGPLLGELIGGVYAAKAKLLGKRTGELHLALASEPDDRAFAPEPFNALSQRSVYQTMRASLRRAFDLLEKKLPTLPESFRAEAEEVLATENQILAHEQRILDHRSAAVKIRIHGDYHLGQALYTGKDFVILDFEGEPARALSERKLKRSALRDVAGMMRSFQYAAYSALWQPAMRAEDIPFLEHWADLWYRQMGSVFLQSYLKKTRGAAFIPDREPDLQVLLEAYLLDKAVYEVGYELNNRPAWVVIPIRGIKHLLQNNK